MLCNFTRTFELNLLSWTTAFQEKSGFYGFYRFYGFYPGSSSCHLSKWPYLPFRPMSPRVKVSRIWSQNHRFGDELFEGSSAQWLGVILCKIWDSDENLSILSRFWAPRSPFWSMARKDGWEFRSKIVYSVLKIHVICAEIEENILNRFWNLVSDFVYTVGPFALFYQAEDGIRVEPVTGVQTCAITIYFRWLTSQNRKGALQT